MMSKERIANPRIWRDNNGGLVGKKKLLDP